MCKGQFTVILRYHFNPLPFQHFRWHKSTFISLRAAVFKIDASQLEMTSCPHHRDSFGSRWQSGRPICTISDETANAAHNEILVSKMVVWLTELLVSICLLYILAACSTGSLKSLSRFTNFVFPLLEWLSVLVTTKILVRIQGSIEA